jgi:putative DNA-invertase from lambdoid prophage Rac
MTAKARRAAIYARVSTDDQSCERQLRDLTAFAERAGFEVIYTFTETASGAKNDCTERAKVMALAQARKIDAVLVTELTRWGRSTIDLLTTLKQLAAWKVSAVAEHGWDLDLSTPHGEMMVTFLAGISQYERQLLAERTKNGLAAARAKGRIGGRPKGNKTVGKHKREVLKLIEKGLTYRQIAEKLSISKNTVGDIVKAGT